MGQNARIVNNFGLIKQIINDMKISISDFSFFPSGYGHYKVTYTSPITYKKYTVITNDMQLIDATKSCESPKRKDLEILKRRCKNK